MSAKKAAAGKSEHSLGDHRRALDEAAASLPPLLAIVGENDFLRADAVSVFRQAWLERFPGGDVKTVYAGGDGTYAELLRELSGNSLFAREKLVILRQGEKTLFPSGGSSGGDEGAASPTAASAYARAFAGYLAAPSGGMWLAVETRSLQRNRTVGKELASRAFLVPAPPAKGSETAAWIRARAGLLGKTVSPEAAELLVQAHGGDLGLLAAELEKLALFTDGGREIDGGAVREFLTGSVEFDIFGFTNAIEEKSLPKAVLYARRICRQGVRDQTGKKNDGDRSSHQALAMAANSVLGMVKAKIGREEGKGGAELAGYVGAGPWRAERLAQAAGRYSFAELEHMLDAVARRIKGAHDTGGDSLLALETLAVDLVGARK